MSIVNTGLDGIFMSPLVHRDDSADAGLSAVWHSGKVDAAEERSKKKKGLMISPVLQLAVAVGLFYLLTRK